jgi:transposase
VSPVPVPFELESERVGAMPIINHFLSRLGVDDALARWLGSADASVHLAPATALGVILRCLCLSREPLYALVEWARPYAPSLLGLDPDAVDAINDDRFGRALCQLFDADRASLLTELVVHMISAFHLDVSQLHNDSTSVTFSGAYHNATGQPRGQKPTPVITYGHNKDHRPDLKQLLWILTVSADGAVPLAYRTEAGNTNDDTTHIPTWDALVKLVGRANFLYVADSKLCSRTNMDHIARHGGRFLTVLPRTRAEDEEFRTWVVQSVPTWQEVERQRGARKDDPDRVWWAFPWPQPSADGYRIVWIRSSQKIGVDADRRTDRLRRAQAELDKLQSRLHSPRSRMRTTVAVEEAVRAVLERTNTSHLITFAVATDTQTTFRQESRGRPGANTRYRAVIRPRLGLTYTIDATAVSAEAASDGCFPLITNDRDMTPQQLLAAYKYQPRLEQRHAELKGPMEVAPVFLKNTARIEGLLCLQFLALLIRALIEREIRQAMQRNNLPELSLYPEDRACRAPTATRIFDIFRDLDRHRLVQDGRTMQAFAPKLTALHLKVLDLLQVPTAAYTD